MADQRLIGFEPHQFQHMLAMRSATHEPLLYYIGDLMGDCAPWDRDRETDKCKRAHAMRREAWQAYENLQCHLVQRRVTSHNYEYWAYPGRNVTAPPTNEEIRLAFQARMDRGGVVTAAVKRGGIPYAKV